jgi:Holliday junction resolvasome RuvABC ATP-dependent DNA helicase subunit
MDRIIADCEDYFLQSRMISPQSQIQSGMGLCLWTPLAPEFIHCLARLLLCGGRGFGKTSVAITVAKHLESNPKVFACE